jgi:glutamyl-tRNA synthetase
MPDGRFAPSPTGDLHLGNLRTALLAWLFARSAGSRFVVRMEDLDTASVRDRYYDRQTADLRALGVDWDGPVLRQSEQRPRYQDAIADLERAGLTYPCYCTRREIQEAPRAPHGPQGGYPGTCRDLGAAARAQREADGRPPALRLRATGEKVSFIDRLAGPVAAVVDDVVLRRNDGTPAYNLAVVVDDVGQGVGEVVRGDDLLSSTPRQLHIADRLGLSPPSYAHVPLVLGPDGTRLAKRHGSVTMADRRARGDTGAVVAGLLLGSLGLVPAGQPVGPSELAAVAASFDPAVLPAGPWRLGPADL